MEEMITITKNEYDRLIKESNFLCCLEGAGVDNWDGYEYALESMESMKEKTEGNFLKCEDCGEESDDVEETICPREADLNNEEVPCILCSDCYHSRCMDI